MNGSVTYEGSQLLSGAINVNTGGNIEPLEIEINENGTREITPPSGVDGYAPITIETNVPQIVPVLETLNVTQNGRYEPPSGVAGFDEVNVEVLHPLDTLTVTENGSYEPPTGVYGFSNVNVNVPIPTPVIQSLNVTQNGIYTPPSGVDGYDEINVNVQPSGDVMDFCVKNAELVTNGNLNGWINYDRNMLSGEKFVLFVSYSGVASQYNPYLYMLSSDVVAQYTSYEVSINAIGTNIAIYVQTSRFRCLTASGTIKASILKIPTSII